LAQTDTVSSGDQPGRIRIVPVDLPVSWEGKTKLGMMIVHPHIVMRMDKGAFSIEEASKQKLRQTIRDCLSLATSPRAHQHLISPISSEEY
jgi:hypothetical protein